MTTGSRMQKDLPRWLPILLLGCSAFGFAQVPVDDAGEPLGEYRETPDNATAASEEDMPLLSAAELQELVGPIALYPDDLLAVVLPASSYPLQIVQAGRFLEDLESDPTLKPDESWDDSVVALINYPEVVKLLNDDLDWTWRLGEAVVAQQADVIAAVESFRDRAYAAGNLKSDERQTVAQDDDGYIQITPVDDDVIYVPYYEPERVVVYQPRPAYYYYPRSYPVYYYPYPAGYAFDTGFFWGVTTAFTLGWHTNSLNVFHHSYYGHPYYGYSYWPSYWYRQPSISVYNTIYVQNRINRSDRHYRHGDNWHPTTRRTVRRGDQRITRSRYYPGNNSQHVADSLPASTSTSRSRSNRVDATLRQEQRTDSRADIRFRSRDANAGRTSNDSRANREQRVTPDSITRDPASTSTLRQSFVRPGTQRERAEAARPDSRQTPSRATTASRTETRPTFARPPEAKSGAARQTQVRQSPAPRSASQRTEIRRAPAARSAPRQAQVREAPRQAQVREAPRQAQVREAPRQAFVRQAPAPRSESRATVPQQGPSRDSSSQHSQRRQSGSNTVASSSSRDGSSRSERRR